MIYEFQEVILYLYFYLKHEEVYLKIKDHFKYLIGKLKNCEE